MAVPFDDRSERLVREAVQRKWAGVYAPVRHVDVLLIASAVGLSLFGLLFVYSATSDGPNPNAFLYRQAAAMAIGLVAMVAVSAFDYRVFRAWSAVFYGASLLLLLLVALQGEVVNGSKAWLQLGGFQFQPSELAKASLIVILAALLHERREETLGLRALVEALAVAAVPMIFILLQPDFGTFMVFAAIVFGVLLLARVRVRYLVALALMGVLSVVGIIASGALKAYQVDRITSFLDPGSADPQGSAFNVNQAQIAIGSGQFAGQGLFQGSQTSLSYVPENHTDFIFTVVGEELGFIGASIMLGAFALLLWRALRIAALSRDTFGTLVAGGVVAVFGFQVFINVGMAVGIMPVTGLPLPFVSFGGTSLIGSFLMVGLLQNVHMHRYT